MSDDRGDIDYLASGLTRLRQRRSGAALVVTRDIGADDAAKAMILGRRLGVDPEAVGRNRFLIGMIEGHYTTAIQSLLCGRLRSMPPEALHDSPGPGPERPGRRR